MLTLSFLKMHGCGNDFVVFDDPDGRYSWAELSALAPRLCDRRFGIGGDGVIAVGHAPLPGETWPAGTDYETTSWSAAGSRGVIPLLTRMSSRSRSRRATSRRAKVHARPR